ncbi:hypothetical membrane protein [Corynebacterium kutscheri]|uniref:Hypothetical membrane protein n=1 Tax=Corynebacterium kutscheri TaxID=35755 RepID=A0A0F6TE09_9CORY|nr:FUSC family protein [Corynebacterium kutscheri]AKE42019.1 putative membrane protein [Corynebacterium kutscheri]VEH06152.1 hypothetical membrane protein [Corynebacterium kutscheri]VEH10360.1 hypothetical membrane protein [Corynebacterium kutscheri]VEH82067.1 hypothetical membrane protein [Corynebacterium kutscheri]
MEHKDKNTERTFEYFKEVENSLTQRLQRVRNNLLSIVQGAIAAGIALWIAAEVVGHPRPFFAPMAALIILGLSSGTRLNRALELSLGCALGVALGDLLIMVIGTGYWQLSVAVFLSVLLANFLSPSQLLVNQVAIGSILISTIIPPGSEDGLNRVIDAIVGCSVGIVVMALLPHSPLAGGRREVAKVLSIASSVLADVAASLSTGDSDAINEALVTVRGSQSTINSMLEAAKSGEEDTRISPFLWASRRRVRSLVRILAPVDNSIRNTRVLARRAQVLIDDSDVVSEDQIDIIVELSDVSAKLTKIYLRPWENSEAVEIPELVRRLRYLGARANQDIAEGGVLSAQVILAQSRSLIVDFLQICGLSRESALAVLAPTSRSPKYPPEIWEE